MKMIPGLVRPMRADRFPDGVPVLDLLTPEELALLQVSPLPALKRADFHLLSGIELDAARRTLTARQSAGDPKAEAALSALAEEQAARADEGPAWRQRRFLLRAARDGVPGVRPERRENGPMILHFLAPEEAVRLTFPPRTTTTTASLKSATERELRFFLAERRQQARDARDDVAEYVATARAKKIERELAARKTETSEDRTARFFVRARAMVRHYEEADKQARRAEGERIDAENRAAGRRFAGVDLPGWKPDRSA